MRLRRLAGISLVVLGLFAPARPSVTCSLIPEAAPPSDVMNIQGATGPIVVGQQPLFFHHMPELMLTRLATPQTDMSIALETFALPDLPALEPTAYRPSAPLDAGRYRATYGTDQTMTVEVSPTERMPETGTSHMLTVFNGESTSSGGCSCEFEDNSCGGPIASFNIELIAAEPQPGDLWLLKQSEPDTNLTRARVVGHDGHSIGTRFHFRERIQRRTCFEIAGLTWSGTLGPFRSLGCVDENGAVL